MSKLYGCLQGNRGEATKCGSVSSGIRASLQSWEGSLIGYMNLNEEGLPIVTLKIGDGSTSYGSRTIFGGTLKELEERLGK